MANVIQRYTYLQVLIKNKRKAANNQKTVFPKYRLEHAER